MSKSKKISAIIGIIVSVIGIGVIFGVNTVENNDVEKQKELIEWGSGKLFKVLVDPEDLVTQNDKTFPLKATFGLKDELMQTYEEVGFFDEEGNKPLVIIPSFTASAYMENGFYDYYKGDCDESCLTVKIISEEKLDYNSSANAVKILDLLGYDTITDFQLHQNTNILNKYEKIIVLHNEYVSKEIFESLTSHNNVIFLYPNALYGEVKVDSLFKTITLHRGHGYPDESISNGFNWENDNTDPFEYDNKCANWEFYEISNGFMLNCYPEQIVWQNAEFLKVLKEL